MLVLYEAQHLPLDPQDPMLLQSGMMFPRYLGVIHRISFARRISERIVKPTGNFIRKDGFQNLALLDLLISTHLAILSRKSGSFPAAGQPSEPKDPIDS